MDSYKILKHVTIAIDILFVFLLLFNYLNYLPKFWNMTYIFFAIVVINTIFLAFKIKQIPEAVRNKSSMIYYFSHLFLLSLVIIALNQFLKRQIIIDFIPEITALAIGLGFLTFYAYRNKVEKEIEGEKKSEEKAEKKRKQEFHKVHPRMNSIPLLKYLLKWMYKEGWWYSVGFILIVILFLFLRLYSLGYIDGSDNYNDVAIKALYENGHSFYQYSLITTQLMLLSVKIFGFNFMALKLPFILYSLITIIFIYFIAKFIDKKVALLSILLFAISPWSIILSKVTRDYSFDCMIGAIVLYVCFCLYQRSKNINIKQYLKNILNLFYIILLFVLIYFLTEINGRSQTMLVIIFPFITGIFMFYNILKNSLKINSKFRQVFKILYFPTILLIVIIFLYFVEYWPFIKGYFFDKFYFEVFFNSLTESPWQWFHNNLIPTALIFSFFLFPFLFNLLNHKKKYILNILYSAFFFGLILYLFKYQSHLNYDPTRYVYFLFPVYCIIFSLSIFYFIRNYKKTNIQKLFVILIIILLFFNFTSFYYAINPIKAYEKEKISNLKIDNIGTGRYDMGRVISFIRKNDPLLNSTYVLSGRFNEFILLLDWPIDKNKSVVSYEGIRYDVGENMFLQSRYKNFKFNEMGAVLNSSKPFYLISEEYTIELSGEETILLDSDIKILGKNLKFIKNINNYRIYVSN